ncbi:MAG TPA: tRNA (adenosine(37)-N6)-threonylcarbamoyltransferase complex ATPase subunit type 1 TsaE [Blastocatellia bacterium]|nr:tRNA (adenosine(37)-N6)-threonylcarbamoyltransferase complex ATPase subunit type 1 TsaE [Blastocatellia bacterium]
MTPRSGRGDGTTIREVITHSAEETFELGRTIGEKTEYGAIFLLTGELGAGKTLFTKGLAAGLEIDPADVTSPTFTLVNVHDGRLRLYHVDLYRLESARSRDIGLDEILEEKNVVVVIEWAERLDHLPQTATVVRIETLSGLERRIAFGPVDQPR